MAINNAAKSGAYTLIVAPAVILYLCLLAVLISTLMVYRAVHH